MKSTAEKRKIKEQQKKDILKQLKAGFRLMGDSKSDQYSLDLMSEIIKELQVELEMNLSSDKVE